MAAILVEQVQLARRLQQPLLLVLPMDLGRRAPSEASHRRSRPGR